MNKQISEYAKTHKVLTLQINRESFLTILKGTQKVEHRIIYPSNQGMYLLDRLESCTGNQLRPRPYDALYLINGRRQNAPRLLVEVERPEFVIMKDEAGNNLTFVDRGGEYYDCQMWYHLGKVLATENFEDGVAQPYNSAPKKENKPVAATKTKNVTESPFAKGKVKHNPICVFMYDITDISDFYKTNGVGIKFSDEQLLKIAEFVKKHGGADKITVEQLPKDIFRFIEEQCSETWEKDIENIDEEPDGEFYMILHDELPLELKLACDAINNTKE